MTPASDLRNGANTIIAGEFENSQLNDSSEMAQMDWASEVLENNMPSYETTQAEQTQIEQSAAVADASRIEARAAAQSAEYDTTAEREQFVAYARRVSQLLRANRDFELAAPQRSEYKDGWTFAA